jgi:hypothetical protein
MNWRRTRIGRLSGVWLLTAAAEGVLYYFFLSRPYFRAFAVPFAIAVLVASALETWRVVRGRRRDDRRERERRAQHRRTRG